MKNRLWKVLKAVGVAMSVHILTKSSKQSIYKCRYMEENSAKIVGHWCIYSWLILMEKQSKEQWLKPANWGPVGGRDGAKVWYGLKRKREESISGGCSWWCVFVVYWWLNYCFSFFWFYLSLSLRARGCTFHLSPVSFSFSFCDAFLPSLNSPFWCFFPHKVIGMNKDFFFSCQNCPW